MNVVILPLSFTGRGIEPGTCTTGWGVRLDEPLEVQVPYDVNCPLLAKEAPLINHTYKGHYGLTAKNTLGETVTPHIMLNAEDSINKTCRHQENRVCSQHRPSK